MLMCFPISYMLRYPFAEGFFFLLWMRASNLSTVRDLGVGSGTVETSDVTVSCAVELFVRCCQVWLLVLNACTSRCETDSMLTGIDVA